MHNEKTKMNNDTFSQTRAHLTEEDQEVYRIYQSSLGADHLFGQCRYMEAANSYLNGLIALQDIFRRASNSEQSSIPVGHDELTIARRFFGVNLGPIDKYGITAGNYDGLMRAMLLESLQIAGCEAPACPISITVPPDEQIIEQAFADMVNVSLPVPDGRWDIVIGKLELAALKIEAVLQRCPEFQAESVARLSWRDGTGAEALAEVRQKLSDARRGYTDAKERLHSALPDEVRYDIDSTLDQIGRMIAQARDGELLNARDAESMIASRHQYLQEMSGQWQKAFTQSGCSMPDGLQQPIISQLDVLQSVIEAQAPLNEFPHNPPHDDALESRVRTQLARNVPEALILQTAMSDASWEITKNDWGVPLYRRKGGWVLYQLPGERWARLYHVLFQETYAGDGAYEPCEGASSFGLLRWQQRSPKE